MKVFNLNNTEKKTHWGGAPRASGNCGKILKSLTYMQFKSQKERSKRMEEKKYLKKQWLKISQV